MSAPTPPGPAGPPDDREPVPDHSLAEPQEAVTATASDDSPPGLLSQEPPPQEPPPPIELPPEPPPIELPPQEPPPLPPPSLPPQELRLAVVMGGGASLAVWMGGFGRELNLVTDASKAAAGGPDDPVRSLYRQLAGLMQVTVSCDILAGTSAGGINAALLGLAAVGRCDLGRLRQFWIDSCSFDRLMRDPRLADPPSLLQGDSRMLADIRTAIGTVIGPPPTNPPPTDVFLTTTLLSAETTYFTDDYGTVIAAANHLGLMHFNTDDLCGDIVGPLSLAARSTASFPGAFEPSFLPCGGPADPAHPDMARYANLTRPHWTADGGLLVNTPIGTLLQAIFSRSAASEVRRGLLYVVPSAKPAAVPAPDRFSSPLSLGEALLRDVEAAFKQSIAADLKTIRDHNEQVTARSSIRTTLARLTSATPQDGLSAVTGPQAWAAFRHQEGDRLAQPLVAEVLRQVPRDPSAPAAGQPDRPGTGTQDRLRAVAGQEITASWPASLPTPDTPADDAAAQAAQLGRRAWGAGMTMVIEMLHAGFVLASDYQEHSGLADFVGRVHGLAPGPQPSLPTVVTRQLTRPGNGAGNGAGHLDDAVRGLARSYTGALADPAVLERSWLGLAQVVIDAAPLLRGLAERGTTRHSADSPQTRHAGSRTQHGDFPTEHGDSLIHGTSPRTPQDSWPPTHHESWPHTRLDSPPPADRADPLPADPLPADPASPPPADRADPLPADPASPPPADRADPASPPPADRADPLPADPASPLPANLASPLPASAPPAHPSTLGRRDRAAHQVRANLDYLGTDLATVISRMLGMHVTEHSMHPNSAGPDQAVELIEASADTRTLLDPARVTAEAKLTGMQDFHFGGFYKASWRANDWMWGRLDGAGWLVHALLDPRRIAALLQADQIAADQRAAEFLRRLDAIVGDAHAPLGAGQRAELLSELAFLDDESLPMPASLPQLALWAAAALQRYIAAEELAVVADQLSDDQDGGPSAAERAWLTDYHKAAQTADENQRVHAIAAQLPRCPVPGQTIVSEAIEAKPLFVRTAAQAAAVTTAALTSLKKPPASLRPVLGIARTITLTAYKIVDFTGGVRRNVILTGLGMIVAGVLAMLTHTIWLGLPGLVLFGTGTLMMLIATWGLLPEVIAGALAAAILLLAAAPWLPWFDSRLFSWISVTFLAFLRHNKWAWTVFFLLVLIPPATMVAGLLRGRRNAPPPG